MLIMIIVTIIATGFDKKSNKQPLYNQINQTSKRTENKYDLDDDEDSSSSSFEPTEIEIPTFMHKNF